MEEQARGNGIGYLFMVLVTLWAGALSFGFGWAAATGSMSSARTLAFGLVAAFLGLLAGRTAYELVRRVRGRT